MTDINYEISETEHWRHFFETKNDLLGAHDFIPGEEVVLQLIDIKPGHEITIDGGKKDKVTLLIFEGNHKVVLNVKKSKVLGGLYGNKPSEWVGKYVQMYPGKDKYAGKEVDAIFFKNVIPISKETKLEEYEDALKGCKSQDELKEVFLGMPRNLQGELVGLKDELKEKI